MLKVLTLALAILSAVSTNAEWFQATPSHLLADSGNDFLQQCKHIGDFDGKYGFANSVCASFVSGFMEGTIAADELRGVPESARTFCPPDTATYGQVTRIILKAIEEHPELAHNSTRRLAGAALVRAFPCK